ncbi:MFS transporter [Phytohalomonas tamaricis]|uniref:MFS transporter n=1 Tax=Phytohalomonas tamaricis TaxID=2081032 RepID=UPI0021D40146|nr:MFS transporter [Phytohalomonas tamaricis]
MSARLPFTVYALSLCQALLVSGNILLITIIPLLGERLAAADSWSTLPVATQLLGLTCAAIPAGWLTARHGRRITFMIGNLVGLSGVALCMAALVNASFAGLCAGTFAIGLSIGIGMLYRFAAVDVAPDALRDRAIALVMAGGVLAALIGPWLAVVSRDLVAGTPFLGSFIGLAGLYMLALVIIAGLPLPAPPRVSRTAPGRPWKVLLRQPTFISAVTAAVVGYTTMNLAMTATPLAMHHAGLDFAQTAHVIQWHVLAMFVPSFFSGHLTARLGHGRMIALGAGCLIASVLTAQLPASATTFFSGLILLGLGWNFTFLPASAMLTLAHRPEEKARVQAANELVLFGLVSLSALLAGPLEAQFGWALLNALLLPWIAFALGVVLWQRRAALLPSP